MVFPYSPAVFVNKVGFYKYYITFCKCRVNCKEVTLDSNIISLTVEEGI